MTASVHWPDAFGYLGALLLLGTYSMKTMIPLRILGLCANCAFIVYGYFAPAYPQLLLHVCLLPLNGMRLYQMLPLVDKVNTATRGNLDLEWLKPFMTKRACQAAERIFSKGDVAAVMYYTLAGRYRLTELDKIVGPGEIIGELGLISPENKRTQTFECIDAGELLTLSYDSVRQLYFQNPKFGFYFLRVMGQRLFRDLQKLEQKLTPSGQAQLSGR